MKTIHRIYQISVLVLFIFYASSCKKTDIKGPLQTIDFNSQVSKKANFSIKSNNITQTQTGYKFAGELFTQSSLGQAFGIGSGDYEIDTATDGSVTAVRGVGMVAFPSVGVFGEMLKTFAWKKVKAHVEYETGQYYIDHYQTELPLTPDVWYLHFKPLDETPGNLFELKQKLNSLVYHFADFYLDPLDPSIMMKADISIPEDPVPKEQGYAAIFLNHLSQGLNDNNPISFKAMIGISNQGLFQSKAYEFPVKNKEFFKSKYGMNSFESSPSNYFVKMEEPGIPVPFTRGLLNIVGKEYLHQPAIMTELGDFSQPSLLDYLNNGYEGGYMLDFNGKLRFGGNKYFSGILNAMGALNDVVGKDVFNTDINLDLAQATLQIQFPGTIEDAGNVPSYFRFGGLTKMPLASDIFGDEIKKYIPFFPPPTTQQFIYSSAGPTEEDCSLYLEAGARMHVPAYGELDLGSAYFYISTKGIEMGSSSDIDVGPFHIDGEIKGTLSTEGFLLNMESSGDFEMKGINFGSSDLKIKASSDDGLTFDGELNLPYGLGNASVEGKVTSEGVSFAGELSAGTQLTLPNGVQLPTANMKVSFDESNGLMLEGSVDVPYIGWASVKGKITRDDFSLYASIAAGEIQFVRVTIPYIGTKIISLPYASGNLSISKKDGIYFGADFGLAPFGGLYLEGNVSPNSINLQSEFSALLPIGANAFFFSSGKFIASNKGVTVSGEIDLNFAKVNVSGTYLGVNNFRISGSTNLEKGPLILSLGVIVTSSNISLSGSGTVDGLGSVGITLKPDWDNKALKACWDVPLYGETCITF